MLGVFVLFWCRWLLEIPATQAFALASLIHGRQLASMMADWLAMIRLEYHVYTHDVCRLSLEEVLRTAMMEVPPTNLKEEVMLVYET